MIYLNDESEITIGKIGKNNYMTDLSNSSDKND